jgi:hypothetical protein
MTIKEKKIFLLLLGWEITEQEYYTVDLEKHTASLSGSQYGAILRNTVYKDFFEQEELAVNWAYEYATGNIL